MNQKRLLLPPLAGCGEVITVYAHRESGLRNALLANLAWLLAGRRDAGSPVLMVDWDLEQPGLHAHPGADAAHDGLLDYLEACRERLRAIGADAEDDEALARRVLDDIDWQACVQRVDASRPLYLLSAGRMAGDYGLRAAALGWDRLLTACPALFRCFADLLARHFQHVLVAAPCGEGEAAHICTTRLPRKLLALFTPEAGGAESVAAVALRAIDYRCSHQDEQRPLLIYPLPCTPQPMDAGQRHAWRHGWPAPSGAGAAAEPGEPGFQTVCERLLRQCYGLSQLSLESYCDEIIFPAIPAVDAAATAVSAERGGDRLSLTRSFEALFAWTDNGHFPWQSRQETVLLDALAEARASHDIGAGKSAALNLARILGQLGGLYAEAGRMRQALNSLKEALALRQRMLGEDHAETLALKAAMVPVLRALDKLDEAESLDASLVDARSRLLGAEHPDTLAARLSQVETLARRGQIAQALALAEQVRKITSRILGDQHVLSLSAWSAEAELLARSGEARQAREIVERVVATRSRLLGAEHTATLAARQALAQVLQRLGEEDEARRQLEAVLAVSQSRRGADHPASLQVQDALAELMLQQADAGACLRLQGDLAALRERKLGPAHPDTMRTQQKLASLLVRQGQLDAARSLQEQLVAQHQRLQGADDLATLRSKRDLAETLWQQGHGAQARALEDAVLLASEQWLDLDQHIPLASPHLPAAARGIKESILAARER